MSCLAIFFDANLKFKYLDFTIYYSFITAARPETADPMYERLVADWRARGIRVETGVFGAHMKVSLVNDGPVTILLDSRRRF